MDLKCSSLVVLVILVSSTYANVQEDSVHLYNSMNIIMTEAQLSHRILLYANYNSSAIEQKFYFHDFIDRLLSGIQNVALKILIQRRKVFYKLSSNEVLMFDDVESLEYFLQPNKSHGSYNLPRCLLYISSIRTLDANTISKAFGHLFRVNILNVILIVQLSNDNIVLVTYFPFTPTECYSLKPVIINRYDHLRQQWMHSDYFPQKLKNFYGCPIRCATWEEMPYLGLQRNETTKRVTVYNGFEGKLLEFAAQSLNFTTMLYIMNEEEINQIGSKDGGVFEELFSKNADFSLGCYYYKPYLNESAPYSQTDYYYLSHTYVVTNVFNVYSTYEKIAYPFQLKLWYIIGLIFALCSVLILACECSQRRSGVVSRNFIVGEYNPTPLFHLYTLALGAGMPSSQLPRYNFARFLLTCWMLATLVLRSAYQSGMYEMMRDNKHRNPPQTITDVLRQNYVILLKGEYKSLFDILPDMRNVRDLNVRTLAAFPEMVTASERTALVTQHEYFGYFGKINSTTWRKLHLVNERIYTQQLVMNVRPQSYLVTVLNEQIASAQYFGFVNRWAREYFGQTSDGLNRDYKSEMTQTIILSMHELGAVFMILLWLHLVAVGVFILEIVWHKWMK